MTPPRSKPPRPGASPAGGASFGSAGARVSEEGGAGLRSAWVGGAALLVVLGGVGGLAALLLAQRSPAERPDASGAPRSTSVDERAVDHTPFASFAEADGDAASAETALPSKERLDVVEANNRATLLLAQGELDKAVELFQACVDVEPGNDVFVRNLAEALVRSARVDHDARRLAAAVEELERAIELAPERPDIDALRTLAHRWASERDLEATHWTEGSDLFELSYDTERLDILHRSQDVLDHLEHGYEDLCEWFLRDPVRREGRARIRVVLYTQGEFEALTGLGDWAGGAFDGVVRVAVEDLDAEQIRWERTLVHELVHAFVQELGGRSVPGWLNEGLAQFLEQDPYERARPASARWVAARERLGGTTFPLERLEGSLAAWSDPADISRAYAQSLLLVQRIAHEYGESVLRRMVVGCSEGVAPAESFETTTSVPLSFVVERL